MDLKEICLTLVRELHQLVPYDRAAINLPHEGNRFIVYAEESRLPASAIPAGVSVVDGTATGWAVEHRETVICRDVLEDDRFPLTRERYRAVGLRSYVILPLMAGNEVLGVLNLGSLAAGRFGPKEIDILSPIARILSRAVENSRLYEESQKREEMQKLLKEISQDITSMDIDSLLKKLTRKIREVLRVDVSDVRLMEEGAWRSLGVSGMEPGSLQPGASGAGRGLSRSVLQNRRLVMIPDMIAAAPRDREEPAPRNGFHGYIGAPLFSRGGEVIGVLRVLTYRVRHFTQYETDLLEQLAGGAAIAIENARLFKEVRQKSRDVEATNRRLDSLLMEQSAMREVFSRINLLDLDQLLRQLTEHALILLQADQVRVVLLAEGGAALRTVAALGVGAENQLGRLRPLGRGRAGWIIENKRPLALEDISREGKLSGGPMAEEGMKGFLGIPLISRQQKSIGLLAANTLAAKEFTPEEIALGQQFAAGAAIAIENATLLEEAMQKSLELEDAFKLKTDFLNTMAHELRTPLNVVIGTQQLLLDGSYGELRDEQQRAVERIGRYAGELLALINEILDLMRLDAKKVPVHFEEFSARDLTDDLELSFEPLAREKGLELGFTVDANVPRMKSDRAKLREILQNLLANAVKYTEKGKVAVRVRLENPEAAARDRRVSWAVSDTGIGIGVSDLPHLFEPFYMAEGVDRRKYPGSGLGLSIVQRLVELLDGRVRIESSLGEGSTFTVTLPVARCSAQE